MSEKLKNVKQWTLLAGVVLAASVAIAAVGWQVWSRFLHDQGEKLTEKKLPELKKRLDENPKSIFMFDAVTSYRLKPSFRGLRHDSDSLPHVTNSWGILGDREVDHDPAVAKILFLGDSVAYGSYLPYEETFIPLMQERAGSSFQLLNAACPGWSTHQELAAYRRYFAGIPLRALVVVFCLNDLLRFEWVWRNERSFQMSAELRDLGGLFHSALTDISLQKARERFWSAATLSPLAELNNTCLNAYLPESWKRYRELNLPLFRETAGRAACFLIALPSRVQLQSLERGGDPGTVLYPQERIREICGETGWEYLDLLPAFRAETGGYEMKTFLEGENGMLHLSPEGNRRLADYLWPRLSRLALTP